MNPIYKKVSQQFLTVEPSYCSNITFMADRTVTLQRLVVSMKAASKWLLSVLE